MKANDASIGAGYEDFAKKPGWYWALEQTAIGRVINDVIDKVDNALVLTGAAMTFSRENVADALGGNRELAEMKTAWREEGLVSARMPYLAQEKSSLSEQTLEQGELFRNSPDEQRWLDQQAELPLNDIGLARSEINELKQDLDLAIKLAWQEYQGVPDDYKQEKSDTGIRAERLEMIRESLSGLSDKDLTNSESTALLNLAKEATVDELNYHAERLDAEFDYKEMQGRDWDEMYELAEIENLQFDGLLRDNPGGREMVFWRDEASAKLEEIESALELIGQEPDYEAMCNKVFTKEDTNLKGWTGTEIHELHEHELHEADLDRDVD